MQGWERCKDGRGARVGVEEKREGEGEGEGEVKDEGSGSGSGSGSLEDEGGVTDVPFSTACLMSCWSEKGPRS